MPAIKKRAFSLPDTLSDFIDEKVMSGDYANSSEVVRAGLRALKERDDAAPERPHREISGMSGAAGKSPTEVHPIEDIFDDLRTRHEERRELVRK